MMNLEDQIKQFYDIFNPNNGAPCDFGCEPETVPEMIAFIKQNIPNKCYCTVKQWTWIDIDIPKAVEPLYEKHGIQPAIIVAQHVIEDEAGRWRSGWYAKTSGLVAFHENCIFETQNTAYILVGGGVCSRQSFQSQLSLFF